MAKKCGFTPDEQQKLRHVLNSIEDLTETSEQVEEDKARDCVGEQDIQRIIDLGLGRGIDATNPTPWKNKTSFQVRPVTFKNIIGTEEGGCVHSYDREVDSVAETRGKASSSVTDPKSAITVGVEAEFAQSTSGGYKVVGMKVLNRTISFKDHCIDNEVQPHLESDSIETQLCKWIMRKADDDEPHDENANTLQVTKLNEEQSYESLILQFKQLSIRDKERMVEYCIKFIAQFRVTHYVSSIQLGASGYEVLTRRKLSRKLGIGGHIGVEKIASGSLSATYSKNRSQKASNIRRIGVIELKDGIPTVKRGSHQEAVVGIQVKPISDLVTMRELRTPLEKALLKYLRNEGEDFAGPFYIRCATSCGARCLYWKVDGHLVTAGVKENASKFYIKPSGNPKHPDEFYICYYDHSLHEMNTDDEFDETKEYIKPLPRYLKTPTNFLGHTPGPLQLGYYVKSKDTRLVLISNVKKHDQPPVSLSAWMSGHEMCFIQCARRKRMKGFIAVREVEGHYRTCCVHSKHNEDESTSFMLFQLVKTPDTKTGKTNGTPSHGGSSLMPQLAFPEFPCDSDPQMVREQTPMRGRPLSAPLSLESLYSNNPSEYHDTNPTAVKDEDPLRLVIDSYSPPPERDDSPSC